MANIGFEMAVARRNNNNNNNNNNNIIIIIITTENNTMVFTWKRAKRKTSKYVDVGSNDRNESEGN